jgi:VanZ family protein
MDHDYFEKFKPKVLGAALLFYILVVTLLFTLAPYNYSFTNLNRFNDLFDWQLKDSILNIILFIPIGFLLFPILPKRKKYIYVTLFGILFSSFIEFNQIFIPTRSPSFNDIVTNSAGALIGSLGHQYVKKYAQAKSERLLNLGISVMNIVFLIIPLLWLSSFAAGYEVNRLWLLLLLGIVGAILVSDIYIYRIPDKSFNYLILFNLLLSTWYLIGIFPALVKYPKRIIFFLILINIFAFLRSKYGVKVKNDKRFELKTINKIIPLFILYILLLNQWPPSIPEPSFQFSWLTDYKLQRHYFLSIYRYVEYFTAFAMVGYLLSEYINRSKNQLNKNRRVLKWLFILTIFLEIPRGFHPGYSATMENVIVSFAWGIFGAGIYQMQLKYFKFIKDETETCKSSKTL